MRPALATLLLSGLIASCVAPISVAQQCPATVPVQGAAPPPPLPVFPADNWWNLDIRSAPVDPGSAGFISFINNGGTRHLHPDFGGEESPGSVPVYGFPYAIVDGSQPKLAVTFETWDESDGVNMSNGQGLPFYPIPAQAIDQPHWVEGGSPGNVDERPDNDRHLLIIDCTHNFLYELYNMYYDPTQSKWFGYSGAFYDMSSNDRRPEGWTSADAAGLAIFPGLVRYDEAANPDVTDIGHAFRVTVRDTNGYVYPASHVAGSRSGAPPMGTRLRLKALVNGLDPVLRTSDPTSQKIFRAMQKYGLIVADNGSDMYISGTFDVRWNNDDLNPAFSTLTANDFEVVQLGWNPPSPPKLSIGDVSISEGDSGTKVATFTVSLSATSSSTVSYDIGTADGTATAGSDYVASILAGQSIPPGQTSKTFSVTINGDTTIEPDETFAVYLSNAVNATILDDHSIGTISNDDSPSLSIGDASISEGNAGTKLLSFTVHLSQAAATGVTYNIATSNGTATAGSDYVASSLNGQLIPAGNLSKSFNVTLNGDTTIEPNETFTVTLSNPSGATISDAQATGTISNDDVPSLSIGDASISEGNAGTKLLSFTVHLSQAATTGVTYNIATANGTATAGSDYVASSLSGQLIPAGNLSKSFNVTLNGDTAIEANETFTATISNPSGATIADAQATGTISNDDVPSLSISDAAISEGNSGTKTLVFTVHLSQAASTGVTYNIATSNGTATAGSDYVANSLNGQLIPAGNLSKNFSVTLNGDTTIEPNETIKVTLSNPSGATISDAQATGTISNDDVPSLSISDAAINEGNSGTKTLVFTVHLSQAASTGVTYNIATANGTATAGSDYVANSLNAQLIPAGSVSRLFSVTLNGDATVEPNETFTANLSAASGATISDAQAIGTINNDD